MKIKLRKLGIRDLFDFIKTIKNPEVENKLQYNVLGYILKGLKEILIRKDTCKFAILVDNKFVGAIVLEKPDKNKDSYEIGYIVAREYWNQNIATKAVKKICKFGFTKLKIKKIFGTTDKRNPSSGRVLEKAGFKLTKGNKKKKELVWEKKK